MTKSRRDVDNTPKPDRNVDRAAYVPGMISGATLAGVVVLILLSYMNWQETRQVQKTVEARLADVDDRLADLTNRPAPAAAPARGPDPNRVYTVKTDGAPYKGPQGAPVSIVEFSDFQ
jgi:hypothetical protein